MAESPQEAPENMPSGVVKPQQDTPHTWRELLGRLIENPSERQRAAFALKMNPATLTRWVKGESDPLLGNFKKLVEIFPEQRDHFLQFFLSELSSDLSPTGIPVARIRGEITSEYLLRLIAVCATATGSFRAWSIRHLGLQQAIELLDPAQAGMEIIVVACVPPRGSQPIRSLCGRIGIGTVPWEAGIGRRLLFLGAESLAGWSVGHGVPEVVQDIARQEEALPLRVDALEKSAAAWPFQRDGKIAGCLLISAAQPHVFTNERLAIVEGYANALANSFRDEEFYPLSSILLHELQVPRSQESLLKFQKSTQDFRRAHAFRMSEDEAEVQALQELEDLLIVRNEGVNESCLSQ